MMVRWTPALGLLPPVLLAGCLVDVALENRPCPCDEARGVVCDPSSDTCVPVSQGICGVTGVGRSAVRLDEVRVAWRTDTAMEIAWTIAEADLPRVSHYAVVLGTSREALLTRGEGTQTFGRGDAEHPELERSMLPNTAGLDPVNRVVLRDLAPNTRYFVQLLMFDLDGDVDCGAPLEALTYVAARDRVVLYDEAPFGFSLPSCVEHLDDPSAASRGAHLARYVQRCEYVDTDDDPATPDFALPTCEEPAPEDAAPQCFENVRLRDLGVGPVSIAPGPFTELAHLQLDVALDDTEHGFWAELGLVTNVPDDDPDGLPGPYFYWRAQRQTLVADGAYRTYTAPLSSLRLHCFTAQAEADTTGACGNRLLTPADLLHGVAGIRVGTGIDHQGAMRLDRAELRY